MGGIKAVRSMSARRSMTMVFWGFRSCLFFWAERVFGAWLTMYTCIHTRWIKCPVANHKLVSLVS